MRRADVPPEASSPLMRTLASVAGDEGLRAGLLATTYAFGLRHGVDWDHIAAITDVSGSQPTARKSMRFASLYAAGHATVVFALGGLAILAGQRLPESVDAAMERVVGVTLVLLGVYVLCALVRHGRDFRMRSRWMLVFGAVAKGWHRARRRPPEVVEIEHDHEHGPAHGHQPAAPAPAPGGGGLAVTTRTHSHRHRHRAAMPEDPFGNYGNLTSFLVGAIHGVGAETPTQVVVFLTASQVGGAAAGMLLLAVFVLGLLTSNSIIAAACAFGYLNANRSFAVYATVAVVTAVFSLFVGLLFVFGSGGVLPAIFGG